jgi:hypothetical protein
MEVKTSQVSHVAGNHAFSVALLFAFVTFASPSNQSLGVKEESTVFFHSALL